MVNKGNQIYRMIILFFFFFVGVVTNIFKTASAYVNIAGTGLQTGFIMPCVVATRTTL